jgi:hypothetical protein
MRYTRAFSLLVLILLIAIGCGGRGNLTPDKAIIGHWKKEHGTTEMFLSPDKRFIIVEGEKRGPYPYIKREINDKDRKIAIATTDPPLTFSYTLNADNTEMLEDAIRSGAIIFSEPTRWKYLDNKQEP